MKKVNRISVMLWIFFFVMLTCIFRSNPYINMVVIFVAVLALMFGYAAIEKKMNEKEKRFFNKLDSLF